MNRHDEPVPTHLLRAAAGLGTSSICVFRTELIPRGGSSDPRSLIEATTDAEWHSFATIGGRLIAQSKGSDLAEAIEKLLAVVQHSVPPRRSAGGDR